VAAEPSDYQTGSWGYGDNHYSKVTVTPGKAAMYDPNSGTRVLFVSGKNASFANKTAFSEPGTTTFTVTGTSGNPTTVVATHHEKIDLVDRDKVRDVPADCRFDKEYKDQLDKVREPYRDPMRDSGDTIVA
jgi:hypothetical protein